MFLKRKGGNGSRTGLLRPDKGIGDESIYINTYFIIFPLRIYFLLSFLLFYCISFFSLELFYSRTCVVSY